MTREQSEISNIQIIKSLYKDIQELSKSNSSLSLIIGEYSSDKTFLSSDIYAIALRENLVTAYSTLAPIYKMDIRLGEARNLYTELISNLSTKNNPNGNALGSIINEFIATAIQEASNNQVSVSSIIYKRFTPIMKLVGGYDFAKVINAYWVGHKENNKLLQSNVVRWLQAGYDIQTDAIRDLGVRSMISNKSFYNALKLMSLFIRQVGYIGLLINFSKIEYALIYFYSIERQFLTNLDKENISDSEYYSLYIELIRLKNVYGENHLIHRYIDNLIEYLGIIIPHIVSIDDSDLGDLKYSLLFRYRLATTVKSEKAISPMLALAWLKCSSRYHFRIPAIRCKKEFDQLFIIKYTEKFGDGMKILPNKMKLDINYKSSDGSYWNFKKVKSDLTDSSTLYTAIKKLIEIADLCTDELGTYSRYLAKYGASKDDLIGLSILSNILLDRLYSNDRFVYIKEWIQENIDRNNGLVLLKDFYSEINMPLTQTISKKEVEWIKNLVKKAGFGLVPDMKYHHSQMSIDGSIVFFQEQEDEDLEQSEIFNRINIILRLGAMVATADNHLDKNEISLLKRVIELNAELSPREKKLLNAYLLWLLNTPTDMSGLRIKLSKLKIEEKELISHILINIALADGVIHPLESKLLEKLYTLLGLDKSMVISDIHMLSSHTATSSKNKEKTILDEEILKKCEQETEDAQNILSKIFDDEESSNTNEPYIDFNNCMLDNKYQELYDILITKDEWSQEEMKLLCKRYDFMVSGVVETINEWAYELVDAPAIEEDGHIYVDREIVEEISELKG